MNMIDIEKRKRIMQRSIKLGHCICNPQKSCPCDIFKEKDVCLCAGERLEHAVEDVQLTKLVENAGCASKINQNDLKQVLAGLPEISDPRVLVGTNTCDDAGVYKLDDETALVQTVDVFTPGVDDPYTFGQIAAANSVSDIYAMGGKPLTALTVIGFPIETVSPRVMTQMLRGGMDKLREAGVTIIGGHSINDPGPKFGYAVTGLINPSKIVTNAGAQPGDVLVLTKPIGVGIISFANQMGKASKKAMEAASRTMTELNKTAAEVMLEIGVNAATDVTGFGLLGHLSEMVSQSGVTVELYADRVPVLDEVMDYVSQGIISGAIERNREYASQYVSADEVSEEMMYVLYDPQTSGGLLIAVPEEKADDLSSRLKERGVECTSVIGKVVSKSEGRILIKDTGATIVQKEERKIMAEEPASCCGSDAQTSCCASQTAASTEGNAKQRFIDFMQEAFADGAIPVRTKELIIIALSILTKCEPCVKIHVEKARSMGVTEDEINEAVWLAISMGGAPIMKWYESL